MDKDVRQQALNPTRSFIVEAPAGSGKTELLTQRFLSLLSTVEEPEEILAVTFTKKAAAEMRHRVVEALQIENPSRLRIMTIDALCSSISNQMPLLSKTGGNVEIAPFPKPYYRAAIEKTLLFTQETDPWYEALKTVLLHFDNRVDRVKEVLAMLLAKRDQWLIHLAKIQKDQDELRHHFENILGNLVDEHIEKISTLYGTPFTTLIECIGLADTLLTKENQWRKKFSQYADQEELRQALVDCRKLPSPELSTEQLHILTALGQLLPVLVAYLRLIFQETNKVDFTEVTLSALEALGDESTPSDLILKLDYQIKHILIDEYQDTSVIQYKLFEKLVSGWQQGDGRTLFLVGDPMQSIYRFRGAEVSLFSRTQAEGLGQIKLESVQLKMNFRSTPAIVNWINEQFKTIVSPYSESIAALSPGNGPSVFTHPLSNAEQDDYVMALIQKLMNEDMASIAVLVRSRKHLNDLIPKMKEKGIPFVAHEVEHLAKRPHIVDLFTLLRATQDFTNTVAWLSLLRSPVLGLTLSELVEIQNTSPDDLIWTKLLTQEGRTKRFVLTLQHWLDNRHRSSLTHWLKGLWQALGGPDCFDASSQKDFEIFFYWLNEYDVGGTFIDIDAFEEKMNELYADVVPLQKSEGTLIELMTIHKAKGLEFDAVILPHCEAAVRKNDPALLIWQETITSRGMGLLFAAYRSSTADNDPLYDYLHYLNKQKEENEIARLFYVGVSRAKQALHLITDCEKRAYKGSFWQLLYNNKEHDYAAMELPVHVKPTLPEKEYNLKRLSQHWVSPWPWVETPHEPNLPEYSDPIFRLVGTVFHRLMKAELYDQPKEKWQQMCALALKRHGLPHERVLMAQQTLEKAVDNLLSCPKGTWLIDKNHIDRRNEWALSVSLPNGIENIIIDSCFVDENNVRWIVDYKLVQTTTFSLEAECEKYRAQLNRYKYVLSKYEKRNIRTGLYFPLQQAWIENVE